MRTWRASWAGVAALLAALVLAPIASGAPSSSPAPDADRWLLSWLGPHVSQNDADPFTLSAFHTAQVRRQTIRQVIVPAADGSAIRLRLSNALGRSGVSIGGVTVAENIGPGPTLVPGTARPLFFDGQSSLHLGPGEVVVSDPVEMKVTSGGRLAIDTFVRSADGPYSGHSLGSSLSWVSPSGTGDLTGETTGAVMTIPSNSWAWIHSLEVLAEPRPVVVVLGDSISTGYVPEVRYEWPSRLAARLGDRAVVVEGAMVANNLLPSTVCAVCNPSITQRLERDALDLAGVTHVVVLGGQNDITQLTPVDRLQQAFVDIAHRARARGVRTIVATLTPRQDWYQYYQPKVMGPMRHELNDWIRSSTAVDAMVDFDAAIRDPLYREQIWPPYDSGDRLHPSVLGMQKLADSVDLDTLVTAPG